MIIEEVGMSVFAGSLGMLGKVKKERQTFSFLSSARNSLSATRKTWYKSGPLG